MKPLFYTSYVLRAALKTKTRTFSPGFRFYTCVRGCGHPVDDPAHSAGAPTVAFPCAVREELADAVRARLHEGETSNPSKTSRAR